MKKYIIPTSNVILLRTKNTFMTTSQLNMGGSSDAEDNNDLTRRRMWDEEEEDY